MYISLFKKQTKRGGKEREREREKGEKTYIFNNRL